MLLYRGSDYLYFNYNSTNIMLKCLKLNILFYSVYWIIA